MPDLSMLGRIRLEGADGLEVDALLRQPKRMALLAFLALPRPGAWHRRDTLLATFWPDLDGPRGRTALRNALYVIRQHLPQALRTRGDEEVSLDPAQITTDVALLEDDIASGRWESALERYRGELLPGFFVPEAEAFEKWLDQERFRVLALALRAAALVTDARERAGDLTAASEGAARAYALGPDDEPALRRLMELLHRSGAQTQALVAYERFRERVSAEYSAEPSDATRQLAARIREHGPAPSAPEQSNPATDTMTSAAPSASLNAVAPHRVRVGLVATVAVVLAAGAWVIARALRPVSATEQAPSLVILPMDNDTGDPALAYLATGVAENVGTRLQGIGGLQTVQSAARAEWPRAVRHDFRLIGREFGSRMALRSSLTRVGDSLVVHAMLVDLRSGVSRDLRKESFTPATVLDLESRLAAAVAGAAFRRPIPHDLTLNRPVDPESYRLTMMGWHQLLSMANAEEAGRLFLEATRIDPLNARAWAGLSSYWASQAVTSQVPFEQGYQTAEAAAMRSLTLDSAQGVPWANLGVLRALRSGELAAGEELLARAITLEPGNPEIFMVQQAMYRHAWQWEKARDAIRIAQRLDPLTAIYIVRDAVLSMCADRPEEALGLYRSAAVLSPPARAAGGGAWRALARLGRWDEALAEWRATMEQVGDTALLAAARNERGEEGYWRLHERLARPRLRKAEHGPGWVSRINLAMLYVASGDIEKGLSLLEAEARTRDAALLRLPCAPDVQRIRDHPRFQAVLRVVDSLRPR